MMLIYVITNEVVHPFEVERNFISIVLSDQVCGDEPLLESQF